MSCWCVGTIIISIITLNTGAAASTDLLGEIFTSCGWDLKAVFKGGQYQAVFRSSCVREIVMILLFFLHLRIKELLGQKYFDR